MEGFEIMEKSMFYTNFEPSSNQQASCIKAIQEAKVYTLNPIYLLKKPISEKKIDYNYQDAFLFLIPGHKMAFIDFGTDDDAFEEFQDDFIDDIGYIAKKYDFLKLVGRPRQWKEEVVERIPYLTNDFSVENILKQIKLDDDNLIRKVDVLISLVTGSINEAKRLGNDLPNNILDQIKRKIIQFDGEQARFVFDEPQKNRITIQGLAGTGKTELLLHKLKELYTGDVSSKIVFTCYNLVLADSLRKRVPDFFTFMKVEEQIQWEKRLWVMRSWGSQQRPNSGIYSYICDFYHIPFHAFSHTRSFDAICNEALSFLTQRDNFQCCFDYILVDESQDFPNSFFQLCEKVTRKCVYIAGDIFQDIFESREVTVVSPDFLLNKCYRTDPRTLMGAHAIGMGLFEQKLRWLKDEEWEACGYAIQRNGKYMRLTRQPLKRFEDIDTTKVDGIKIIQAKNEDYLVKIIEIIDTIRRANPTVIPDDISIIFMENSNSNYQLASELQSVIKENYGWPVNIGYETKERKHGTLFLSNRNNVKGLEFPFVICIMQNSLSNDFLTRNSLYMMLTRSFLTSYLILPQNGDDIQSLLTGIQFVNRNGYLEVEEPSDVEKKRLSNAIIQQNNLHKSLSEMVENCMDEIPVLDKEIRKQFHDMVKARFNKEVDRAKLEEFIRTNYAMMEK